VLIFYDNSDCFEFLISVIGNCPSTWLRVVSFFDFAQDREPVERLVELFEFCILVLEFFVPLVP
jgi:hypothetical protein